MRKSYSSRLISKRKTDTGFPANWLKSTISTARITVDAPIAKLKVNEDRILTKPIDTDESLDTTGLYCPLPVVKTAERIKTLRGGTVLEVVSDDGGIEADLPAWCKGYGHEYLGCLCDGCLWRLYIRKKKGN